MQSGITFYLSNISQGNPVSVGLSVSIRPGMYTLGNETSAVSGVYNASKFKNDYVVYRSSTKAVSRIDSTGTSLISTGLTLSDSWINDLHFYNSGGTLEMYYISGRTTPCTIFRINSSDGDTWGNTTIIYGGSHIGSLTISRQGILYFTEGVSRTSESTVRYNSIVKSAINDGSTWRVRELYNKPFATREIVDIASHSYPEDLDDVFILGTWGSSGTNIPNEMRLIRSNGYEYFGEETLIKQEATATGFDYGNRVEYILAKNNFGSTNSKKILAFDEINIYVRNYNISDLTGGYGSAFMVSNKPGEWSGLYSLPGGLLDGAITEGSSLDIFRRFDNSTASQTRIFSGLSNYADISADVIKYTNTDNKDITLEVGNIR